MNNLSKKIDRRFRIKKGIRKKISGTSNNPRLSVFRSNKEIYAQIIDDKSGVTLVTANSLQKEIDKKGKTNIDIATEVGKLLAKNAKEANVTSVIFDRSGYLYHGRVKALADGAREGGLQF